MCSLCVFCCEFHLAVLYRHLYTCSKVRSHLNQVIFVSEAELFYPALFSLLKLYFISECSSTSQIGVTFLRAGKCRLECVVQRLDCDNNGTLRNLMDHKMMHGE